MQKHPKTLLIKSRLYKEARKNWDSRYGPCFEYDENLVHPSNQNFAPHSIYYKRTWLKVSEKYNFKNFSRYYYVEEGSKSKRWYRLLEPEWNHLDREKRKYQKSLDKMNDDLKDFLNL
jgi:hypothetical protein